MTAPSTPAAPAPAAPARVAPAIRLHGASVAYGDTPAVREVTLDVAAGEMHVLLGESGSGKTTILRAVAGFEPVCVGRVELHGAVVDRAGDRRAFVPPERRSAGVVFQDYALFPHLDVAGNVAFAMRRRVAAAALPGRVSALLERVGLAGLGGRAVSELSGGQQQRVALARALAQRPRVMLLDEPFSNLDRELRGGLRDATLELLRAEDVTAIFVTHDRDEAFALADRISVIADGRLLQSGSPAEIYRCPGSLAVARSVGDVDVLPAQVTPDGDAARCALGVVPLARRETAAAGQVVLIRPEQIEVVPGDRAPGAEGCPATVARVRYFGGYDELALSLDGGDSITAHSPPGAIQSGERVVARVRGEAVCVPPET